MPCHTADSPSFTQAQHPVAKTRPYGLEAWQCCTASLYRAVRQGLCAICCLLALQTSPLYASSSLPTAVRLALDRAQVTPDAVSIWVQPVDAPAPSLIHNAGTPMNPASVMKLVTAFAAFEQLGPAHIWSTRFASTAAITNGTLTGDLYLIGSGDPVLDQDRVSRMLRRLRGLGIERIAGDIVLDASVLSLPPHNPDAFDGRGLRPYNSGPYGLLMHYNTQQLALFPARSANEAVTVIAEPALAGVVIDNRIVTSGAPCELWYRDLEARLEPGRRLVLSGSLPGSCGPRTWSAAPLPPAEYGTALVATLWSEAGGRIGGTVREGTAPAGQSTLISHESPPLADIVRDMNKWSSNVIARQLLAALGTYSGTPTSDAVAKGAEQAQRILAGAGVATEGLVIENGSGLSRIERIRAADLGQMLIATWYRPWMPEFISALPVAGLDGTARRRLGTSPARGQAHIKTGTINGVRAIAGYVLDRHGRRHAVVMMVNHTNAANTADAQDALLEWVWAGKP